MTVWRISNHPTLNGAGGLRTSGRWHSRGQRVVYCAPNPAAALLEILVHAEIDLEDLPASYRYLEIEIPEGLSRQTVEPAALAVDWASRMEVTRAVGDEWLASLRSALLLVPSVIVPSTWNILINPRHPEAGGATITRSHTHPLDVRLL